MSGAAELIEQAFTLLQERQGFVERKDQLQLALLIADCIEGSSSGAFEAPTGLGKSLATLIPAIALAKLSGKRTVIGTYTNVLAEQYWRNDLPLALSLFEGDLPKAQFLIGRQRYACIAEMQPAKLSTGSLFESRSASNQQALSTFRRNAELGIETEFRTWAPLAPRDLTRVWQEIAAPPVCPARMCPHYHECYYYRARRGAERAEIVITNHNVILQDAQLLAASEGEMGLLGDYDFLILDEAHDFPQAAANAMEFELNEVRLGQLSGLAGRMEAALVEPASEANDLKEWTETCEDFRKSVAHLQSALHAYGMNVGPGILAASPPDLMNHPQVSSRISGDTTSQAKDLAASVAFECQAFIKEVNGLLKRWEDSGRIDASKLNEARDAIKNYSLFIREFGSGSQSLFAPEGVSVSFVGSFKDTTNLRHDVVNIAEPLRELLWDRVPAVCLSATLALDASFEFFRRQTGFHPSFEEILDSPFDFSSQAAIYLPPAGKIPDPSVARKENNEPSYFDAISREMISILHACGGRTLALFHSRREMEEVFARVKREMPDASILLQRAGGVASVGERFKKELHSSLFALRSFWTGFDAPGETLSCVVLVRVPFEVPVDPPQVARMAWLQSQGLDPFGDNSLPNAKMIMRQGAGRLIRRAEDRGVIALLDPRIRAKRYGEEILANLPPGMRNFDDIEEAAAWVGIQSSTPAVG